MKRSRKVVVIAGVLCSLAAAQVKEIKPGWNLFSKEQDIQLGREAAAQVERQMPVIHDQQISGYLQTVGRRLASVRQAQGWPFSFTPVADKSINAFALPGGPMFVNTGAIQAADNEAQLAGVMAHEMSHVILRHGTHQATKAQALQIPAAILGGIAGRSGSMLGQLSQLGIGLGFNSVLLKYSRDAERDADLLGAQIMSEAGYNPIEMANFFEKLERQGGSRTAQFFSDHPNPGNRVKYVQDEARYLPQRDYNADTGRLPQIQAALNNYRAPNTSNLRPDGAAAPAMRPSGRYRELRGNSFTLQYPDNWQVFGDQQANTVTIAPQQGLVQGRGGNTQVGYGVIASYYLPQGNQIDLRRDTDDLIRQLAGSNPTMQMGREGSRRVRVNGQDGLETIVYSSSPFQGEREVDTVVTLARPEGLFYLVMIAPETEQRNVQPIFESIVNSVRFNGR